MSRLVAGGLLVLVAALALACGAKGANDVATGCDPGWHACGSGPNDCAPDNSTQTCGTRCTPCPAPSNGIATCVAGACGIACNTGTHLCSGACVDDGSATACGAGCVTCQAPGYLHARAACVAGACDYACDVGFLRCAAGCCTAPRGAFARLSCGAVHTCGVARDGTAKCWGGNGSGQLGDGSPDDSHVPVAVSGSGPGTGAQVAAAWDHTCGVDGQVGGAWCWGDAWAGQLGDGSWGIGTVKRTPVAVSLSGAQALMTAAGWAHSCALLAGGAVKCWGNNDYGQLGTGSTAGSNLPVPVSLATESYALLSGSRFSCAVTGPASMACWGDNGYGQLGNPTKGALERAPVPVENVSDVSSLRAVALGAEHACVAYDKPGVSGAVRCWGRGDAGQLGNGQTPSVQKTGVEVLSFPGTTPLLDVVALGAGEKHTCAVTAAGALRCWGGNDDGQLGVGPVDYAPRTTAAGVFSLSSGVGGVSAGTGHTCALVDVGTAAEKLWCWGRNASGQVGDGTTTWRTVPVAVAGF
jgi:alpha-tubulin suppressor-like RCC1 family protein